MGISMDKKVCLNFTWFILICFLSILVFLPNQALAAGKGKGANNVKLDVVCSFSEEGLGTDLNVHVDIVNPPVDYNSQSTNATAFQKIKGLPKKSSFQELTGVGFQPGPLPADIQFENICADLKMDETANQVGAEVTHFFSGRDIEFTSITAQCELIDNRCNFDVDGDGVTPTGGDCNDSDPNVAIASPENTPEACQDGVDNDCDGVKDAADPDCNLALCGDGNLDPGFGEVCDDGNNTSGDGCTAECQVECPCAADLESLGWQGGVTSNTTCSNVPTIHDLYGESIDDTMLFEVYHWHTQSNYIESCGGDAYPPGSHTCNVADLTQPDVCVSPASLLTPDQEAACRILFSDPAAADTCFGG